MKNVKIQETVRKLFKNKDRKRKAILFKFYSDWIYLDYSLKFICELINDELGEVLVNENDIKYIRRHFKKPLNQTQNNLIRQQEHYPKPISIPPTNSNEISWTDPDSLLSNNKNLKSKFSK